MKVKELAVILNVSTDELLNILPNVGVDVSKKEESEVGKDVEKKLAKRYNVPYPFKVAKPKPVVKKVEKPVEEKPVQAPVAKPVQTPVAKPVQTPATNKQTSSVAPTTKPKQDVSNKQPTNKPASNQPTTTKPNQPKQTNNQPSSKPTTNKQTNNNQSNQNYQKNNQKGAQPNNTRPQTKQTTQPVKANKPATQPVQPKVVKPTPKHIPDTDDQAAEAIISKYEHFLEEDEYNITRENRTSKKKPSAEEIAKSRKKNSNKNKNQNPNKKVERRTSNIPNKQNTNEKIIFYEDGMSVMMVAEAMNVPVTDLVKKLFSSMGIMATANQALDRDTIELIAMEYDYEIKNKPITDMTRYDEMDIQDSEENLVSRPPVVTIMGHVDHGKTTLLDTIRNSHIVESEAGRITQNIGAYQVNKNGKLITFIDTPGHAAFTEMRARGAQITDIVILVVAADDGVMPQTKEAIEHAQAAGVPIIVAINKMDVVGANPDRIKQALTEYNLIAEEWGGDTIFVEISALAKKGIEELLDMVILLSELKDYKANPNRLGIGTVIEAKLDKKRGPVASLLVQNGTLKVGDIIVIGNTYGKVRAMRNELGESLTQAGPSKPVEISGIAEVPFSGEKFMALNDEKKAKEIAEVRSINKFNDEKGVGKPISLNDLYNNKSDDEIKNLNLIIKCDVQGSIEAIKGLLANINIEGTKISIVSARVGGINDNDISLAIASKAVIIGFNIRPSAQISDYAKEKGVEIRLYNIIYKLQEDIEKAMSGMLDPVFEEKITGQAEVRQTYKVSKIGMIAGCYVTSGSIVRSGHIRIIRDSIVIYTGRISSLKHFKDDVKEAKNGFECGLTIENFNDIKVGDIMECFIMEEKDRD